MVSRKSGVPQISTGDILREAVERNTELGGQARKYMDAGELVPDEVVLSLVRERIGREDCAGGFILDGFPRTLVQADGLARILEDRGEELDAVIFIDASDEAIISRLSRRRVCPGCGAPYNLASDPPEREGVCDKCGARLEARADDAAGVVKTRLEVYRRDTLPLVEHYESEGLLRRVDGEGPVREVYASILAELGTVLS
jgi:adenylate kinase